MVVHCFAVYDSAAQCFGRPMFAAAVGLAVRSFQDEVNREARDNPLFAHYRDFRLFALGTFDDSDGRFKLLELPELVLDGAAARSVASAAGS